MTEQYVQTVDVDTSLRTKLLFIVGLAVLLVSLVFIIVAVLVNYWFFVGFGSLFVLGFVLVQMFESAASQYIYGVSTKRIVIYKKNNAHNGKRIANVTFDNVKRFEEFCDIVEDKDIVACKNTSESGVYALVFNDEQEKTVKRILFSPDEYLIAFIKENLSKEVTDVKNHIS